MSNLSDIGFPVQSEEEFAVLLEQAFEAGQQLPVAEGIYVCYLDMSGAELWLQLDHEGGLMGLNPHFRGETRRTVALAKQIDRPQSPLDGAWLAWSGPTDPDDPESGDYPFVFDLPNALLPPLPHITDQVQIQLTGFAQQLSYFPTLEAFETEQEGDFPLANEAFIPISLFGEELPEAPEAFALLTGKIVRCEQRLNQLSGHSFYYLVLHSFGGELDIVADPELFDEQPQLGAYLQCHCWMSAQIVEA